MPPEIVITPNFDTQEGQVDSFIATHPIFSDRNIGVYLPPGFTNTYKQFPVTIMIDLTPECSGSMKTSGYKFILTKYTALNLGETGIGTH